MAKITITSTATAIIISTNDYYVAGATKTKSFSIPKEDVKRIEFRSDAQFGGEYLFITLGANKEFWLTSDINSTKVWAIESVDNVPPTDLEDLRTKIETMLGWI